MKASRAGLLAGFVAAIVMTAVMLLLISIFGIATPLVLVGDRLSVFIPADQFLWLMGKVGGYNHMKQLGVGSVIAGQLVVGSLGGILFAKGARRLAFVVFVIVPLVIVSSALWPVLGTHYGGLPIIRATFVTVAGLLVAFVAYERTLALGFEALTTQAPPNTKRRALIFSGLGLLVAGGSVTVLRKLYAGATFAYDGLQYKGRGVQPITPNDEFYCVTKNVIDPQVDARLWRLQVSGLVATRQTYRIERLKSLPAIAQETTLMCISNGLDAGLMSNALWRGVPMRTLLNAARPLPSATKVRLHGVDNYTDTIPLAKALDPATLIVYEMNGEPLPHKHGFPARAIVPGYFGEKHVKWITRIELADERAIGFYEKQGWGPDFIVPTRSRIDEPLHEATLSASSEGILVRGVAFGGDRGISRVELSTDDTATWTDARLDYPGTKLTWSLWSFRWQPRPGDYVLLVRATDGDGKLQEIDADRPFKSGVTGFHRIVVHVV